MQSTADIDSSVKFGALLDHVLGTEPSLRGSTTPQAHNGASWLATGTWLDRASGANQQGTMRSSSTTQMRLAHHACSFDAHTTQARTSRTTSRRSPRSVCVMCVQGLGGKGH